MNRREAIGRISLISALGACLGLGRSRAATIDPANPDVGDAESFPVEPWVFSLGEGTLREGFSGDQRRQWDWSRFLRTSGSDLSSADPTWRRYRLPVSLLAGKFIGDHFDEPVPWIPDGQVFVNRVRFPVASVAWRDGEIRSCPVMFEMDFADGICVWFREPVVKLFNAHADLEAGGDAVAPPLDISVMIPVGHPTDSQVSRMVSDTRSEVLGLIQGD